MYKHVLTRMYKHVFSSPCYLKSGNDIRAMKELWHHIHDKAVSVNVRTVPLCGCWPCKI